MGLKKNTAGQFVVLAALDITGAKVAGEAGNITATIAIDGGTPTATAVENPVPFGNYYLLPISQAECNADHIWVDPVCSTPGVDVSVFDGNGRTDNFLAKLLAYFRLALRKDAGVATDQAAELAEINADAGSGAGGYDNTTDSPEAVRDRGDSAWLTGSAGEFVPVQPRVIHPSRVWTYDERSRSRPVDIVKVRAGFAGRLAFAPALNEGEAVRTLDSVTIDGSAVGITDLGPSGDYTQAVFTTAALAAGTYEVVAQVTTTGGDVIPLAATLRVD